MNPYGKKNIAGCVWELLEGVAEELGYRIWNVEYVREGADMYLRVTIDSDAGINIEDCERMTRAADPILDEADPIDSSYIFEVSSPGVERVLTTDEHFARMAGCEVELKLYRPIEHDGTSARIIHGILVGRADGRITVNTPSGELSLESSAVARTTTVYDWQADLKK